MPASEEFRPDQLRVRRESDLGNMEAKSVGGRVADPAFSIICGMWLP
jgi:hypothetical protein